MNKKWIVIALLIFSAFSLPSFSYANVFVIAADPWAPYNAETDGESPGYGIEIAREIFKTQGTQVRYEIMPWRRALDGVRSGEYNAVIGATPGDAPDFIFPEEEVGEVFISFFVPKNSPWNFSSVDSLSELNAIGIISGYSYGETLDSYILDEKNAPRFDKSFGDDPLATLIRKMAAGRLDAILEDENVFREKVLKTAFHDEFRKAGVIPEGGEKIYIAFSPHPVRLEKSREFVHIFDEGMKRLRKSGNLMRILEKYGVSDWR